MANELHEECGVFGIYAPHTMDVATAAYYGLFALQHRGQESCGICVNNHGAFSSHKDEGLVNEVFTKEVLDSLGQGNMAVGHVRYGTTGGSGRINAQPITINRMKGSMATAHNGNLTNALELREALEADGSIFHTTSDTEIIAYVVTMEQAKGASLPEAVNRAIDKLQGAYSLVLMDRDMLVAARDEHGFRPLCYGKTPDGCYVVVSESCALTAAGAQFIRDIAPGEILAFGPDGVVSIADHCNKAPENMCVFEYIYFARPDSVIDGFSVHRARLRAGAFLAEEHPVDADIVIGVPDSGIDAAIGYSKRSGIPYGVGFIKNKYIGRTFISPGQKSREDKVKIKLNPIAEVVRGKRVILVDDSIVRGTTSERIVWLLREAGAKEVHMRITAPPFINPCYYGTDIDSRDNLIACHHPVDEIARIIGVDSLGYLNRKYLPLLPGEDTGHGYCTACFTGEYPTTIPQDIRKEQFEC